MNIFLLSTVIFQYVVMHIILSGKCATYSMSLSLFYDRMISSTNFPVYSILKQTSTTVSEHVKCTSHSPSVNSTLLGFWLFPSRLIKLKCQVTILRNPARLWCCLVESGSFSLYCIVFPVLHLYSQHIRTKGRKMSLGKVVDLQLIK